jgi:hypothetical protein
MYDTERFPSDFVGKQFLYSEFSDGHIQFISKQKQVDIYIYPNHQQNHTSNGTVQNVVSRNIFYINGKNIGSGHKQYRRKNRSRNSLSESGDFTVPNQ